MTNWYKISKKKWKDHLPGGKADGKTPDDFDKEQVERGADIEREHTDNRDIAKEISTDHLIEHPAYYYGLKHMEELLTELEKDKKIEKPKE